MVKRSFDDIFGCGSAQQAALFETLEAAAAEPSAPKAAYAATKTKKQKKQPQLTRQSNPSVPAQPVDDSSTKSSRKAAATQRQDKTPTARTPTADQPKKLLKEPRARPAAKKVTKQQNSSDIVTIKPSDTVAHESGGIGQTKGEETAPSPEDASSAAQKDERLDRTIFVGNIQADTKPKVLKQLFTRYGQVDSVRMRSIPVKLDAAMPRRAAVLTGKIDSKRATAHAYVVFSQPDEAVAALAHNMQLLDGLHICVNAATKPGCGTGMAGSYNKSRSIFVGNLNFAAQDEDLVKLFSDGSRDPQLQDAVTAVRVVRDSKTNIGKGIAFVEFNSKSAAAAAMQLKDLKLDGRTLRISFLKTPKSTAAAPLPSHHGKAQGSVSAKSRIQKREAVTVGKKQTWAGTKSKRIAKPVKS